ncbi:adhesion G-protein coupled receptor G1-like [Thunnus maccoyii]|uniref:adhesion G-protein coupled receptor G1-like n=1 Tax=Thunnus maccoyii TaxID=8240 RepID=UPI001C4B568E|nr:adhesion G-protein coupled receptor G1-like [Thunnus maccoyii]
MMLMTLCLVSLVWVSTSQAVGSCANVFHECQKSNVSWTRCYDYKIRKCRQGRHIMPNFIKRRVNSSQEAVESPTPEHGVHIPPSALQRIRGADPEEEVQLVITVLNSTYFKLSSPLPKGRGRVLRPSPPVHRQDTVMGESVLVVKAGNFPVRNLPQPIKLIFKHNKEVENGTCVFWEESELGDGTGHWSPDGCHTTFTQTECICSCNHLSFFAVLVRALASVDVRNVVNLGYITYIGPALSVFFTANSLIIYICLQNWRPEKVIGVHMQLAGALLCLHLSFLVCSMLVLQQNENEEGWVCQVMGLILHWSLLATISWTALEGFHLYLLLVQVLNVKRYLLKLSLVGWGLPTLIAVVCGVSGVYGKYSLELRDANNHTTVQMCWMSSKFPQRLLISYVITMALLLLLILCNSCMLGLVVCKLQGLRGGGGDVMNREKGSRLWKDCATVLGLSCVLGLPWVLGSITLISLPQLYLFTVLNSLSGVFVFLWSWSLIDEPQR